MRFLPSILPAWLVDRPWPTDLGSWVNLLFDFWHAAPQGTVLFFGFVVLWIALRRERKRLSERIETLRQIVTASSDQSEEEVALAQAQAAPPASPPANGGTIPTFPAHALDNWQAVRAAWRDIRDRLELLIEAIPSGRVRGKYSKMPRRRYRDIVNALEKDGELRAKIANTLLGMETTFNRARTRPKSVTDADAADFVVAYQLVREFLPESPDGSDLPPQFRAAPPQTAPRPAAAATASSSQAA